jgi:hypothetical protein
MTLVIYRLLVGGFSVGTSHFYDKNFFCSSCERIIIIFVALIFEKKKS